MNLWLRRRRLRRRFRRRLRRRRRDLANGAGLLGLGAVNTGDVHPPPKATISASDA